MHKFFFDSLERAGSNMCMLCNLSPHILSLARHGSILGDWHLSFARGAWRLALGDGLGSW